ncbi:MAG: RsiV family protein [Brevefilum sp.]|nr:RsiV family protein [Brevefilum sp.]MDT8380709.1 RsiV family protein [Brevefilum sp.]MDW7753592.1 RsiV family protein [Brevefilum sp.]
MNKKIKLASFLILTGLVTISCSLPLFLTSQSEETSEPPAISPTHTVEVFPRETPDTEIEPITQEPEIRLIDRSIFEEMEEPRYEIDGVWPNLEGPEPLIAVFNTEIDRFVDAVLEDFLLAVADSPSEMEGEGEPPLSYLTFDYDLTYADQQLFSIYLAFDQYIAMSAHPFPFSKSLNYDAQKGVFLSLEDLFLPETDYINEIGSLVEPILEARGFGYQLGTAVDVMQTRENWNLLPEALRINFDVYEVAPYAAGPQYVVISWEDLVGILDPNGPISRFID